MVIQYLGQGCFRLQSGEMTLLVNPQNNRLKGDIVLKTLTLGDVKNAPEEICYPGEYEIKGVTIQGWQLEGESTASYIKTVYRVDWEEMAFIFLGHISKPVDAKLIEDLGEADIIFIPTGDPHFISPEDGTRILKQLNHKVAIPAYYKNPEGFLKAMGVKAENQEKMVFRKKDLDGMTGKIIVLSEKE